MENIAKSKEEIIDDIYNTWCQLRNQTNYANRCYGCDGSIRINTGYIVLSFYRCCPHSVTLSFSPDEPETYMEYYVECEDNEELSGFEFPKFDFDLTNKENIEYAYEDYIMQWIN